MSTFRKKQAVTPEIYQHKYVFLVHKSNSIFMLKLQKVYRTVLLICKMNLYSLFSKHEGSWWDPYTIGRVGFGYITFIYIIYYIYFILYIIYYVWE